MEKFEVNPGLLAALDFYSHPRPPGKAELLSFTHTQLREGRPHVQAWTVGSACGMAWNILSRNDLAELKFKTLVAGMQRHGMDGLYRRLMGEEIDKANDCFK